MLLIWDIHINARHSQEILAQLRQYTEKFSDEKNLIFLGDYMYMFSYDRQALSELFDFFLAQWREGKNIYIVAGNHDRLNQHFVYHEGKKVADILNRQSDNKLYFITEPESHTIEWKKILFMPYNKLFLNTYQDSIDLKQDRETLNIQANTYHERIRQESMALLTSKNHNEQLSWALNYYLLEHYEPNMRLIHHYYTADISFPWQFAKFDYKDIALHPSRTEYATKVISWHLHKAFIRQNYLCMGSIWSTTSGERDHAKYLWQWDTSLDTPYEFKAYEIAINPYLTMENAQTITRESIEMRNQKIHADHEALLPGVSCTQAALELHKTSVIIYSNESVENIENLVDPEIKAMIQDIQIKQRNNQSEDMTSLLDIWQYNIQQSLLDRKELVKKYLMSRYWTESDKYRTLLSQLNIL